MQYEAKENNGNLRFYLENNNNRYKHVHAFPIMANNQYVNYEVCEPSISTTLKFCTQMTPKLCPKTNICTPIGFFALYLHAPN